MKIALLAAIGFLGFADQFVIQTATAFPAPAVREKSGKDLADLEDKLLGYWEGKGGCVGNLTLRADGTYEQEHVGPDNASRSGTWSLRWDALPPTMILTIKKSDDKENKTWEVKVIQLDDNSLEFKHPNNATTLYSRTKE